MDEDKYEESVRPLTKVQNSRFSCSPQNAFRFRFPPKIRSSPVYPVEATVYEANETSESTDYTSQGVGSLGGSSYPVLLRFVFPNLGEEVWRKWRGVMFSASVVVVLFELCDVCFHSYFK